MSVMDPGVIAEEFAFLPKDMKNGLAVSAPLGRDMLASLEEMLGQFSTMRHVMATRGDSALHDKICSRARAAIANAGAVA
jgi:hypothetical protein